MKIGELARRAGLSVDTLRYYEKIGLLPHVGRDDGGRRDYDKAILAWTGFIARLKTTGMALGEIRRYADLRAQGPATANARCALLSAHRARVADHIAELQTCLAVLDDKIASYASTGEHDDPEHDSRNSPRAWTAPA